MSKNVVEPDRPQMIWRMRVANWISKATRAQAPDRARVPTPTYTHTYALISVSATPLPQTHTEMCNTYCFSTATMVSRNTPHCYVKRKLRLLFLFIGALPPKFNQPAAPCTRWFKYDRDYLCVNKSQFVPVIFEPPCTCRLQWRNGLVLHPAYWMVD
jgi:hypothetical protein